ncbi:MAG: nitrogen fixation protein NifQ [Gammaproteobacteria bacterium]|nr:nitrogen fixation protein NifQ [Chromatiaceae bacterium]MCU0935521.1 nitrogen fixation protein NifQ [Gammaproteobacteria bacterium]
MSVPAPAPVSRAPEQVFGVLMGHAVGAGNDADLAAIYATWSAGGGALPDWLGLSREGFFAMMDFHFPRLARRPVPNPGRWVPPERLAEAAELRALLVAHRAGDSPSERWMAEILAAGCLARDHLWQDLGLWSRADLGALMRRNFPALAARNVHDMKWKRFLYKQLCEAEGIYLCRAPSCEVCTDYERCFGPEH